MKPKKQKLDFYFALWSISHDKTNLRHTALQQREKKKHILRAYTNSPHWLCLLITSFLIFCKALCLGGFGLWFIDLKEKHKSELCFSGLISQSLIDHVM